jgi:hypothetical protein
MFSSSNGLVSELVVVLAIVFAGLAYVRTTAFRRQVGRNPWGVPPAIWLLAGFLLGLIGLALAVVACATTRVPTPDLAGPFGRGPSAPPAGPPPGWYPDPAGAHEQRWFTGHDWSDAVRDRGEQTADPLPPSPS